MTNATPEEDGPEELNVSLNNYPPSGGQAAMRPMLFGGPGPARVFIELDADEHSMKVALTLANVAENDEIPTFLADLIELLQMVASSPLTTSALAAELARTEGGSDVSGE